MKGIRVSSSSFKPHGAVAPFKKSVFSFADKSSRSRAMAPRSFSMFGRSQSNFSTSSHFSQKQNPNQAASSNNVAPPQAVSVTTPKKSVGHHDKMPANYYNNSAFPSIFSFPDPFSGWPTASQFFNNDPFKMFQQAPFNSSWFSQDPFFGRGGSSVATTGSDASSPAASASSSLFKMDWSPKVDVTENSNEIFINAEMPGISKKDIHIEVRSPAGSKAGNSNFKILTIKGETRSEHTTSSGPQEEADPAGSSGRKWIRSERSYGKFQRQFSIPKDIKNEDIRANLENGVLKISIKKPAPAEKDEDAVHRVNIVDGGGSTASQPPESAADAPASGTATSEKK